MSKINICKYDKNSMRLYSKEIDIPELPDGAKNIVFFDGDDVYIRTKDDRGIHFIM